MNRAASRHSGSAEVRCEPLESRTLFSHTYFVATTGNDRWAGTVARPFATIQRAATVAKPGDTVDIEGGTYRQTIRPAHSGVTFTNYNGQSVIISGTDTVGGWTSEGGGIYDASVPWDLGEGNNQVFVDGQMVQEARWPAVSAGVSNPVESTVESYSNGILSDPSLTQPAGFWAGATITVIPGDGWVAYTGAVTDSGPGWLQVSLPAPSIPVVETPVAGNAYSLSGTAAALDAPGEWYRDSSGTLHLWDPTGDDPALHDVEVKHRDFAFDLTGVSDTTIEGISLFASTIATDSGSTNTLLNGINAAYVSQFTNPGGDGWNPPDGSGIELNGDNSTIENSTIAFSAGDGVVVGGSGVSVTNNVIHDIDYSGADAAGVRVLAPNAVISQNTIYNAGRDGINLESQAYQSAPVQVLNNVIHDFMLQTYDGAGIYTVANNGQGSVIAYNTIYNAHKNNYAGLDADGILLDNDSSNFIVHDNVTANVDAGFKANSTSFNEQVYNNQFGGIQMATETDGWTGFAYDWTGSRVDDNVYYNRIAEVGANVEESDNTFASGSPALNVPTIDPPPVPDPSPQFLTTVSGSISGLFRATRATAKAAPRYTLSASATLSGFGAVRVTGTGVNLQGSSAAAGTIRLVSPKGTLTVALSPAVTSDDSAAAEPGAAALTYAVVQATGAFAHVSAAGTLALTLVPRNRAGTAGGFVMTLTSA